MDKPLRELIEIIHFTESVAAKIHGVLNDAGICRIISDEFARSERYAASILLLTDDASKLKVAETSTASKSLDRLEKAFGLRLRDYRIDVEKSTTYRQVIRDGKTVRVNAGDLLQELLPRRLAYLISRTMGYERRSMVATPLYRRGKIMGALAISSPELVDYFIPSVKNFARHVSTALELACEYAGRSMAEQQLRESERKYRDLVEQSLTAILIAQRSPPQIVFANQGAAEILGYTTDELASLSPKEAMTIIPPTDQRKILELYRGRLEGIRQPSHNTYRLLRKDKRERWVEGYSKNIEYNGKPAVQAVLVDITERRKAEEGLRESEEKFRNIFESAFDVLVYLDESGRVLDVNEKALQLFGVSRRDVVGKHFSTFDWFSTEDLPRLARIFQGTLDGRGLLTTVHVKSEEGQELDLECSASLMKADTKLLGVLVIARDITERKRMERRLQEYAEDLERLVDERTNELREAERMAAIGETAAMVGHDLRNPLQSMVNTLYLIKDRAKSMPTEDRNIVEKRGLSRFWGTLADQAEYMNKIVSDLQDYARSAEPELVSTSLPGLINDALSRVRLPENVMVSTTIPEEFRELKADPVLMRRVLVNLITNAVQAMSGGGKLNIAASQTDGFASISVCDTGVGIAGEDLPKLFRPLFTTKSKGQGFGLSVCRRLVEAHGGSITVESQVGKGSTFTVKIPLEKEVG